MEKGSKTEFGPQRCGEKRKGRRSTSTRFPAAFLVSQERKGEECGIILSGTEGNLTQTRLTVSDRSCSDTFSKGLLTFLPNRSVISWRSGGRSEKLIDPERPDPPRSEAQVSHTYHPLFQDNRTRLHLEPRVRNVGRHLENLGATQGLKVTGIRPRGEATATSQEDAVDADPSKGSGSFSDNMEDNDSLLDWWRTVEGWEEWNETVKDQEDNEELVVEQAADRVYMAAWLFLSLFEQRRRSLAARVVELRTVADAADNFHKRTVAASMGGGVASVAGSVTTITGLALAPITFGTSLIVTAVGIGVATAGGLASASANITDTVHSNLDRKKVEKMIQGYQEEMQDIKECLEFVQEGMNVLEKWNFEEYMSTLSNNSLNQNVKHVMKEGGRAGKALVINTGNLVNTVQVFSTAGGAARAAQAISVTTGVMSALFLALDVFFLAKDSHELRAGAKTKFAAKIREVCTELDEGLLELNRIKVQLQKTMERAELEECKEEEAEESPVCRAVEMEVLEKELDQLENELDQKAEKKQDKGHFVMNEKKGKLFSRYMDLWKPKKEVGVREKNIVMKTEEKIQEDHMAWEPATCGITDMWEVPAKSRKAAVEKQEKDGACRSRANAFLYIANGAQKEENVTAEDWQPAAPPGKTGHTMLPNSCRSCATEDQ
ncbi:apolipoprotein L3-like isoform X1 [Arapaima gigas]